MQKTVTVSNLSDLYSALSKATGGEKILLAQGDYGNFALNAKTKFNIDFPSNVTIASANPDKPAVFSGLDLRSVSNLSFDGVTFDYTYKTGDSLIKRPFSIEDGSKNIAIRNSTFDGDVAKGLSEASDGFGSGFGLAVRSSSGITVENNEIFGFYRGLTVGWGTDVIVRGNDIHSIRMDGMNFSQGKNILIENNHLHDFIRSDSKADHADMIQFWTNGTTKPSTNITIRGNTLDIGQGDATQSIFMRNDMVDRGLAGKELFYRNVLIEDNVIYNAHANGVIVGETIGLTIRNNSVLHADGSQVDGAAPSLEIPRISVAPKSEGVSITGNVLATLGGWTGQPGWTVNKNAFVQDQDPNAPGYYGDVFIGSTLTDNRSENHFVARPGSMIENLGAGAQATRYEAVSSKLNAEFHISESNHSGAARTFDASLTTSQFKSLPVGTTFSWDFGDGTTAKGPLVTHAFPTGGYYDVKLTVKLPNGITDIQTSKIGIAGTQVLEMGADGRFTTYDHGEGRILAKSALASTDGLQLGTTKVAATVARDDISEIFGSDNFKIAMTLQADTAGTVGEVFRLHNSFVATVNKAGELQFTMTMANNPSVQISTTGAKLNNKAAHDIEIKFDDGQLKLFVDGALNVTAKAAGMIATSGTSALVFGNPWGKANFHGDLKDFAISIDSADFKAGPVTTRAAAALEAPVALSASEPAPPISSLHQDGWDGQIFDIATLAGNKSVRLSGDTKIADTAHGKAIVLDGTGDQVALGRIKDLETSDQIAFSVDFARDVANGAEARLVWNHLKVGLTLKDDGIVVQAGTAGGGFKSFSAANLGLNDTDLHRATVMLDAESDRLQVVVDDKIVLDVTDTDFDIVGAGGREWGWNLGAGFGRFFDGAVTDFRLGDRFEFLDGDAPQTTGLLS